MKATRTPTAIALAALAALAAAPPALALDLSWSGFATLGWARSNSPYTYQRYIDEDGGFERDTLLAGQVDLRLGPQWSATAQLRLAPAANHDERWRAEAAWAFVAWRPSDDWLLRAGKLRTPLYLYSESLDVGVSHDMVRLPFEMYSIAPTNDFTGLFATRSLSWGEREIGIDAYAGRTRATARAWSRDGVPPSKPPGAVFNSVDVRLVGLALTAREPRLTWRLGVLSTITRRADGAPLPVRYARVDLAPGLGYWQINNEVPGPGVESTDSVRNLILTAGAEWQFGDGWRLAGEAVKVRQRNTEISSESLSGYLALFKQIGAFTPYVSVAQQRSSDGLLRWRERLTSNPLPPMMPGAAQLNAAQRLAGESLYVFDQRSWALGLSYTLSPTAKIKAEWMRTRVGEASNHFDTPAGQPDARGLKVDSLSVNYSVAF